MLDRELGQLGMLILLLLLYSNQTSKYYSIPTSERKFEYQNPKKTNIELSGKCVQYQRPLVSKEQSNFRSIQIHDQPNSKRTLVPELAVLTHLICINTI